MQKSLPPTINYVYMRYPAKNWHIVGLQTPILYAHLPAGLDRGLIAGLQPTSKRMDVKPDAALTGTGPGSFNTASRLLECSLMECIGFVLVPRDLLNFNNKERL